MSEIGEQEKKKKKDKYSILSLESKEKKGAQQKAAS